MNGGFLLAFCSYQFGSTVDRLIWATNTTRVDHVFLVLWIVLLFAGIKIFRLGLASVPPDPKDQRLNQRGPD